MELILKRVASYPDATIGILSEVMENGVHRPICASLEDEYRKRKVKKETRIGQGRYRILLRNAGKMNVDYKERFSFHKGMLHLQDVPNFKWIYIHPGNTDDHTAGCLLVGFRPDFDKPQVRTSTPAYVRVYKLIMAALGRGEEVWITLWDADNSLPVDL